MATALICSVIFLIALAWLNAEYYFNRSPDWSLFHLYAFWRRTPLIDGSTMRFGPCMRRYVNGAYQYRRETSTEETARESDAW